MDDLTDPISNMVRGSRYLQERLPEWFDKNYSVWVDSSNLARRAKENNMSTKKISAGDTLTVCDLTDDHLGAEIEVGTLGGIASKFRLSKIEQGDSEVVKLRAAEGGLCCAQRYRNVKVITPPPVVQPDEPKILGQCIRIEGDDDWLGMVADPQDECSPILDTDGDWWHWDHVLSIAGERQIIVSDPPRWPDETTEVPERIEVGEWPSDVSLRDYEWVDRDGDSWTWEDRKHGGLG